MNEIREFILSKKLDNSHRKEIKEKYGNIIEKAEGETFNEKLFNFCFPEVQKEYKGKKLKFISFQKGYDFTPDLVNNQNDALLFLQYKVDNNKSKGLLKLIEKNKYIKELWDKILGNTTFEKFYRIKNNILFERIICPVCKKNEAKFQRYKGFTYCSHKCAQKDEKTREKARQTCFANYGVEYPFQAEEVKEKYKQNSLKKYGADNPSKSHIVKEKIIKTNIEKYGGPAPACSKEIKEKIIKTFKENYGVEWNSKRFQKNMENFNKEFIEKNFIKNGFLQFNDIIEYFNISPSFIYKSFKNWGFEYNLSSLEYDINKKYFNNIFKVKDRKIINPYEVDLLNYDLKFGIEFNGVLWHSYGIYPEFRNNMDLFDKQKYHLLEKTEKMEEKGFQLFHIFDTEWADEIKRRIWISMINNKLGLNQKIYARKCNIKVISSEEAYKFFEENHIQGGIFAKYNLGLYYNNELISCMSFSKPRYNKDIEWELIRFATKINFNVIGGASKLLTFFEKNINPKSLISYANRRWSKGNLYEILGFKFMENTIPNFYYYKDKKLFSRIQFQKHKLKKYFEEGKLNYYNEQETALTIMIKNGYRIIYDCGNKKYIKEY